MTTIEVLVVSPEGPTHVAEIPRESLDALQALVGGMIEALPLPEFIDPDGKATAYINDSGKGALPPNMRATDFLVPGVGLFYGDYIAGTMVLCGFDAETGENESVPERVQRRMTKIEREAA